MVIFLNQATQGKEVFLKKISKIILYLIFIIVFISGSSVWAINTKKNLQEVVINHLETIKEFSSQFLQTNGETIEEGNLYLKNQRIKIHYHSPSEIIIIIAKKKAMYFNKDLQELEYFNPNKSLVSYFYNIFYNTTFLNEANFEEKDNYIVISKNLIVDEEKIVIKIFLEQHPIIIRKLRIEKSDSVITFSILNHNFNPDLIDKDFSMINPLVR